MIMPLSKPIRHQTLQVPRGNTCAGPRRPGSSGRSGSFRGAFHGPHGLWLGPWGLWKAHPQERDCPRVTRERGGARSAAGPRRAGRSAPRGRGEGGARRRPASRGAQKHGGLRLLPPGGVRLTRPRAGCVPRAQKNGQREGQSPGRRPLPTRGGPRGGGRTAAAGIKGLERNLDSSLPLYPTRWKGSRLSPLLPTPFCVSRHPRP